MPAASFEVLANSSDSEDESSGMGSLNSSSSDYGANGGTIAFDAEDSESETSEAGDQWQQCCLYRCTTRQVPCRKLLMELMLRELDMGECDSNDETEDMISKVQMLSMKVEKEEKVDVTAPLLQPYAHADAHARQEKEPPQGACNAARSPVAQKRRRPSHAHRKKAATCKKQNRRKNTRKRMT